MTQRASATKRRKESLDDDHVISSKIKLDGDATENQQETSSQASSGYDTGSLSPSTSTNPSNSPRRLDDTDLEKGQSFSDSSEGDKKQPPLPPRRSKKFPEIVTVLKTQSIKIITPTRTSKLLSSDEESSIPLSQRIIQRKKKIPNFRLKQSRADQEILEEMEEPRPSTSGPIRREYERNRRALLAKKTNNECKKFPHNASPTTPKRGTPRRKSLFAKAIKASNKSTP